MKHLILASLLAAFSNLALAGYATLGPQSLPAKYSVPCSIQKAEIIELNGTRFVSLIEDVDGSDSEATRYALTGKNAAHVQSVTVETTKAGWFPKCVIVLR